MDHCALHMCGAGLDCISSTLMLLLLLLRAGGTSQSREEEDRRHGAVVTGIAVVWRFGMGKPRTGGIIVRCYYYVVIVTLHRQKHVHNLYPRSLTTVLALVDLTTMAAWNLSNPLGHDMHLGSWRIAKHVRGRS